MARRRAATIDLMSTSTLTILKQTDKRYPLQIHSPTHSIPGMKPKRFNLGVLSSFGSLGNKMALAFVAYNSARPVKTANSRAVALRNFVAHAVASAKSSSKDLTSLTSIQWRALAVAWFNDLKACDSVSDTTRNSYLSACRVFFEYLTSKGLVPGFNWPTSIPNAKSNHRPSISTTIPENTSRTEVDEWPAADQEDWNVIQSLLGKNDFKNQKQIGDVIKGIVRRYAEKEIRELWHIYQETKSIIASNVTFDFSSYCSNFEIFTNGKLVRKRGWQQQLSVFENLLVYIARKFGGVLPGMEDDPHFLKFVYNKFGKSALFARFHLEHDTLAPLLALIFMERKKMNLTSPLSMRSSDFGEVVGNEYQARWTKKRANYRRLKDTMQSGSNDALQRGSKQPINAAQAFAIINELSHPLRPYAITHAKDSLCLVRTLIQKRVASWAPAERITITNWHEFRLRSGILSKLYFTISQFRPTGAVEVFRKTGDILQVAEELGQKNLRVTALYVQGLEAEAVHVANTRPVQDAFVIAAATVSGRPASDFGISADRKSQVIKAAHSAGFFGYNLSGTENESRIKTSLFEKILSGVKFYIFETPEVAAEIISFRQHVIDNAKTIRGTERYEELWLPILITCSHLIESMSPKIVKDAKTLLAQRPVLYGPII